MVNAFFSKHRLALKWIGIAFAIKIPLFIFFATQFYDNWPAEKIINGVFIESGDTSGYYDPAEDFSNGLGYTSYCRMPGLLPIYFLLRLLFSAVWTKTLIIFLQFIASTTSVYVLALIAQMVSGKESVFRLTFFVYALSSFVSIWDHFGYSDSFSASFLIFSVYFLLVYRQNKHNSHLFLSGFFLAWSIFFRPVHGVFIPALALIYLCDLKQILPSIKRMTIFGLPLLISLSAWTFYNYREHHRLVVLQGPFTECFSSITKEIASIRELITAWGGDIQPWAKGSAAQWFFDPKSINTNMELREKNEITSVYNMDSLMLLRKAYFDFRSDSTPTAQKPILEQYIAQRSALYVRSYKKEKPFRYYFTNKLRLLKSLLVAERLDNLPFPKLSAMKFYHKALKAGYYLLLLFINIVGGSACLLALRKKNYLALAPLSMIFLLAVILNTVEQRYLVPVYPFLLIYAMVLVQQGYSWLLNRKRNA